MNLPNGLFETMYAHNGSIELAPYHQARLQKGLQHFEIALNVAKIFEDIAKELQNEKYANTEKKVRIEVQFNNGKPLVDLSYSDFSRKNLNALNIGIAKDIYWDSTKALHLKTTDRSFYNKVASQAQQRKLDDLIILNEKGEVVETTIFNIIWQEDDNGAWFTPPISSGCLAGVQREALIANGQLIEKRCLPEDLSKAASVKVCNALRGIVDIKQIDFS